MFEGWNPTSYGGVGRYESGATPGDRRQATHPQLLVSIYGHGGTRFRPTAPELETGWVTYVRRVRCDKLGRRANRMERCDWGDLVEAEGLVAVWKLESVVPRRGVRPVLLSTSKCNSRCRAGPAMPGEAPRQPRQEATVSIRPRLKRGCVVAEKT